jgi:hypothetical protein
MRTALLAAAWLACGPRAVFAQSLSFPEGLHSYRLNPILVEGLAPDVERRIQIRGLLFDGREVPLFTGAGSPAAAGDVRCFAYLDEEIQSLKARITRSAGGTLELSIPVELPAPRIAVYGTGTPLPNNGPWYTEAYAPEQLRPGDVRVLSQGADPEPLRAAGIHVVLSGSAREEGLEQPSPWRGYLLASPDLGGHEVLAVLERNRERLFSFKERYRKLVVEASFLVPRIDRPGPLEFPPATPAGIAFTLQRETLGDRVGPLYRYALLAFSLPLVAAVALLRKEKVLLALAGSLLAAFLVFTFLAPPKLRSLTVELALPAAEEQGIRLERVPPEADNVYHYRQRGIPPGSYTLLYRALLAPGGDAPFEPFARERLVRFNRIPEVRQERGRLFLRSRGSLSAWSLREPE